MKRNARELEAKPMLGVSLPGGGGCFGAVVVWVGLVLGLSSGQAVWGAELIANGDCLECHSDKELTKTNELNQRISLFVDEARFKGSVHGGTNCLACHSDLTSKHPDDGVAAKPVSCAACHQQQSESYGASVHGMALQAGQENSATCKDCHGYHDVLAGSEVASPLHPSKLAVTCGECHDQEAREMKESVHGKALAEGLRDAPTCTDCHSEHKIEPLAGTTSLRIAEKVCSQCHDSERINSKYKLPRNRVRTFYESYHGLAAQFGSTTAANCASCHGFHNILPALDPRSTIHPDNLVATCGKCHPGATANFASGKIHLDDLVENDWGSVLNRWVRRIYLSLIVVTIGFMGLHNGLVFYRKVAARLRQQKRSVLRMDRSQRVQHMLLAASFILLAVTGFALKYPDSWICWSLGSDETIRRWVHRGAGAVLLLLGFYHIYYLYAKGDGRRLLKDLIPAASDASDLVLNMKYLAGHGMARARLGRFGYAEKMEYWAVVWGTVIMGVTGLMIWFKIGVTQWLPRWAVDVATTIHYYEAILACLAICVWHFYHVIFDPDVYPLNWACWDGKVTEHWQKEEHPLESPKPTEETAPQTGDATILAGETNAQNQTGTLAAK